MVRLHDLPGVFADYVVGTVIVMTQLSMVNWVERQERRRRRLAASDRATRIGHLPARGYPHRNQTSPTPPN